jgi:hypothetical protein
MAAAELPARVGHALAVVAGARAHRPGGTLGPVELGEQVVGAPKLVRAADLQVLALEPHLRAGGGGQALVVVQRGPAGHAAQAFGRRGYGVGDGGHH